MHSISRHIDIIFGKTKEILIVTFTSEQSIEGMNFFNRGANDGAECDFFEKLIKFEKNNLHLKIT